MRTIKKIFAVVCLSAMVLSCVACGGTEENNNVSVTPTNKPELTPEVTPAISPEGETENKTDEEVVDVLESWKDEGVKNQIIEFVTEACDENSENFIPVEDRIVVTDIDGTLIAEKGIKVNNDDMCYKTPEEACEYFKSIENDYFDNTKQLQYNNIIYKPMIELYDYLVANYFELYFVSGNCNALTYALANYFFETDYAHAIGSNVELKVDETNGFQLVPTGKYEGSWCEVKCYRIYNQIGKCPVLAIGNSDGDVEMLQWVLSNSEYQGMSIMINHDDEREYVYNTDLITSFCDEHGFINLLMSQNFETIFVNE